MNLPTRMSQGDAAAAPLPGIERQVDASSAEADALLAPRAAEATDDGSVAPREAEDLAWLFYTSGTTGRPKAKARGRGVGGGAVCGGGGVHG